MSEILYWAKTNWMLVGASLSLLIQGFVLYRKWQRSRVGPLAKFVLEKIQECQEKVRTAESVEYHCFVTNDHINIREMKPGLSFTYRWESSPGTLLLGNDGLSRLLTRKERRLVKKAAYKCWKVARKRDKENKIAAILGSS